jgi:hypothetical protein
MAGLARQAGRRSAQSSTGGDERVAREEERTGPPNDVDQARDRLHGRADAGDAQHDQQCIGERADDHDRGDVLAADSLAQHEQVLRADGDDDRPRPRPASAEESTHASVDRETQAQIMILHPHKLS